MASSVPGARWRRWALPACIVLVAIPFVVALAALARPGWIPVLDLAMTELRVRDVLGSDSPLVGLPGRIGDFPDQGSHPGPISFYALAPFYRLLGSSHWAMLAAAGAVNVIAASVALWIARRRGGTPMLAAVTVLILLLLRGFGMETFVEPWNPLMPLLWWLVLLLAVWSVLLGDVVMAPVAVVAGSFCAQTHVPYLLLALGVGALTVVGFALALGGSERASPERRRVLWWAAASVGLGVVLWVPPIVDEVFGDANASILVEYFTGDSPEAKIGLVEGARWLLVNMNPWHFFGFLQTEVGGPLAVAGLDVSASPIPGLVLVLAWGVAVLVALRRRHGPLLALHAVLATALLLGWVSLANVFGKQWYYLALWAWILAAIALGTILWTVLVVLRDHLDGPRSRAVRRWFTAGALVLAVAGSAVVSVGALGDELPDPRLSAVLVDLVPATAEALEEGVGAADGPDGRYLVTWADAYAFGSQGYGFALELERLGFDVGVTDNYRVPMTPQRVLDRRDATAEIQLATGGFVDVVAALPGAVEVARTDPRSPEELEEFERLRRQTLTELEAQGLDDLIPLVDENLFLVAVDPRLGGDLPLVTGRMVELGQPTSVFILPGDAP